MNKVNKVNDVDDVTNKRKREVERERKELAKYTLDGKAVRQLN